MSDQSVVVGPRAQEPNSSSHPRGFQGALESSQERVSFARDAFLRAGDSSVRARANLADALEKYSELLHGESIRAAQEVMDLRSSYGR